MNPTSGDELFSDPDWNAPLDADGLIARMPRDSTVRGIFFQNAVEQVRRKQKQDPFGREYYKLLSYPSFELAQVLCKASEILHPDLPLRQGLRRLGRSVFPALRETAAGTFLFSVAGKNVRSAFKLTSRAYELFSSHGKAEVGAVEDDAVYIELRNIWTFPDSYHLGIFEGALAAYETPGRIQVQRLSDCDVDLCVRLG